MYCEPTLLQPAGAWVAAIVVDSPSRRRGGHHVGGAVMGVQQLGLKTGQWLAINCGKFPSEKNCQLVIMAPKAQRDDLLEAASAHAVKVHGHADTPQLRQELGKHLETVDL